MAQIILFPPATQEARMQLVIDHLVFVELIARSMAPRFPSSVDVGDLIQEGILGLIDAAQRFDPARGIPFKTFAERRVKGAMIDSLRRDSWPRGVRQQRRRLIETREELAWQNGEAPSDAEVAAAHEISVEKLRKTQTRINIIEALGAGREQYASLEGLPPGISPRPDVSAEASLEASQNAWIVRAAIASLPNPRHRQVLCFYYWHGLTMKQLGQELSVNESRASQLHAEAVRKLRVALERGAWKSRMSVAKPSEKHLVRQRSRKRQYQMRRVKSKAN